MSQLGKNFIASLQNSGNQRPNLLSLEQKIWGNVCYPGWETPGNGTGECCRAEIKPLSARPKVRILYLAIWPSISGRLFILRTPIHTINKREVIRLTQITLSCGGYRLDTPFIFGAPGGTRTPNLLIRSQTLYPLSYGCVVQLIIPQG